MSRLYDVIIIGSDDPPTWLAAAAHAAKDKRVALILDKVPDPELPAFHRLPIDPARLELFVKPFGLISSTGPRRPWRPEFQVIIQGRPVDITAGAEIGEPALQRDLIAPEQSLEAAGRLIEKRDEIISWAESAGFPRQNGASKTPARILSLAKSLVVRPPSSPALGEWLAGKNERPALAARAVASSILGRPLKDDDPMGLLALLSIWPPDICRDQRAVPDFREHAANLVARRGSVMAGQVQSIITDGGTLRSVRLGKGAILDTRCLIAPGKDLDRLLGREPHRGSEGEPASGVTFFFKIERSTIPESLARRAVVVSDPDRPLTGENLAVLVRAPRVPRRETLAVTFFNPGQELTAESVPEILADSLPWLDPSRLTVDDTRAAERFKTEPAPADMYRQAGYKTGLDNVLLHPGDALPGWGPAGASVSLSRQLPAVAALLEKYAERKF